MYAIRKKINKVLAAFLCACLLLSYNPAFGTTGTAWAAEGDDSTTEETFTPAPYAPTGSNTDAGIGEATDREVDTTPTNDMQITGADGGTSTIIQASTYTSELQVNITPGPLYATVEQLDKYEGDRYPIIVQATCSETNTRDSYSYKWTVTANDVKMSDDDLAIINTATYVRPFDTGNNVWSAELDLKSLVHEHPNMFQNDIKYVFTCEVTMDATNLAKTKEAAVTLFTVAYDPDKDEDPYSIYGNHRLQDNDPIVVAIGNFLTTADLNTDPTTAEWKRVDGVFAPKAIEDSDGHESFNLAKDKDGKDLIYNVSVTGGLKINDDLTLPATDGTGYDLCFPIDKDYVRTDANPTGYKEGDLITVLWKVYGNAETDDLRTMQAKIFYDEPTDQLMAKVTYKPTEATSTPDTVQVIANGTTYENEVDSAASVPGFFTLVYSSTKTLPENVNDAWYTVSATVTKEDQKLGNSVMGLGAVAALDMDGTPVYVRKGTRVQIEILPKTAETDDYNAVQYRVKSLKFTDSLAETTTELITNGNITGSVEGITIDAALSCITLDKPLSDKYYTNYKFDVVFEVVPVNEMTSASHYLNASVVNAGSYDEATDTYADSNNGLINVSYTKYDLDKQQTAQGSQLSGLPVRHGGYVDLDFMVKAGIDSTDYEIVGVQTSASGTAGTWADAAWLPGCQLTIPFMTTNMHVRVLVKETTNITMEQPTYYNVIINTADGTDEHCKVTPDSAILPVKTGSPSVGVSFDMYGVTDKLNGGYYPQYYTVTEGGNPTKTYDLENDETKTTYATSPMTRTYEPSDAVMNAEVKGDIVITVYFHTTNPTPRTLTLVVANPEYGSASVVGGSQAPEGADCVITRNEDGTYTVGSGEIYSVLMVPNSGYKITGLSIQSESATKPTRPMSNDSSIAQTGVYSGKMPDENLKVTVTFGKLNGVSESVLNTGRTLSVYVADESLKEDPDTGYIWTSSESIVDADDRVIEDADIKIKAPKDGFDRGFVNDEISIENLKLTVSDPYVMSFRGNDIDGTRYAVSKVLVVAYSYDDDGNKQADGIRLYPWIAPTFDLSYHTAGAAENVDVIVYFEEIGEDEVWKQPKQDEYVTVVIVDNDDYLKDTIKPQKNVDIDVLPGGYLTITGMKLNEYDEGKYEWGGENGEPAVIIGTDPISEDQLKHLQETGVLVVGPIDGPIDITVNAHWVDAIVVPETMEVGVGDPDAAGTNLNGTVTVTSEDRTVSKEFTVMGEDPAELPTKTEFTLGFAADEGHHLTGVAFAVDAFANPDDLAGEEMNAWYKLNVTGEDGSTYNSLIFQKQTPGTGYSKYSYTTGTDSPNIPITKTDETMWRVEGLLGNMTVLPTFEEIPPVVDPNDDAYTVKAGIIAGSGLLYMDYDGNRYGNQLNVPKGSTKRVTVTITPATGYSISDVTVKTSSDNPLENLWNWLTGNNITNMTQEVQAGGGTLKIQPVSYDYEITVKFDNYDPEKLDSDTVPVNVYSDSNKGQVKPTTPVRVARDGQQQFTVDVKSLTTEDEGTKWYSVEALKVTPLYQSGTEVKTGSTVTVDAGDNDNGITWDDSKVMFTLDVASVAALLGTSSNALSAINVEVVYGPANLDEKPEPTGGNNYKKEITITTSTGGGVVSPLGSYEVYPYEVDGKWATFLVVVSPVERYGLKGLTVKRGGVTNSTLAADYLNQINGTVTSSSGCFFIKADPTDPDTLLKEEINVQFEKLSTAETTYRIHMKVKTKNGATGSVVTKQMVTLPLNESFSYSVNTSASNVGYTVTDKYWPDSTGEHFEDGYDVPASAAVDSDKPTIVRSQDNNCLTVNPATIMNRVVDRWITVTFDKLENLSPSDKVGPIDNDDKVSIKVNVYTAEVDEELVEALTVSPNASLNNILKSDDSHYLYSWWFNETGAQKNYYIYCVTVNKDTKNPLYGSITPMTDNLTKSGYFLFDKDTLTDKVNYLDIYVGEYLNGVVPGQSSGGGDIEVGWGEGGWVQNNNGTLAGNGAGGFGSISGYLSSFANTAGIDLNQSLTSAFGGGSEDGNDGEDEGSGGEVVEPPVVTPGEGEGDGGDGDGKEPNTEEPKTEEPKTEEPNTEEPNTEEPPVVTPGENETDEGGDGGIGQGTVKPTTPTNTIKTYTIVPAPGYVIDHVYLYNCHPYPSDDPETTDDNEAEGSWLWTTPSKALGPDYETLFGRSWTKKIVLQYTLEVDDPEMVGYMYASFEYKGTNNIDHQDKWDPTDDRNYDKLGVNNLSVHFYPHDYAKGVASLIGSGSAVSVLHEGSQGQDGTVAVRGKTEEKPDRYISTYSTLENIEPNDKFTFRVGPLLPEDNAINAADKLYTLDIEEMAKKMPNVTVEPVVPVTHEQALTYDAEDTDLAELADEQDGTETQADEEKTKYYKYYTVKGTAADLGMTDTNKTVTLQLPLDKLTADSGEFPELPSLDKGTQTPGPGQTTTTTYQLSVDVDGIGGTLTPTTTAAVASWTGDQTTSPWTVASGTRVAFSVKADDDYRLTSLELNGVDLLLNPANRYYTGDAVSGTLAFPVYSNTQVVAQFTPKNDRNASRTVSVSVQGGHGTTSPTPGDYPVEKGQPYSIRFVPDSGYVPYRIWVDGVESFVSPTLVGWSLPASWSNQTFRVEFALEGTTPSGLNYLVQTGQNTAADLVRTGNNPIVIACVVGVAALAAFGVWQMRRRKEQEARAAKYSVTKRK